MITNSKKVPKLSGVGAVTKILEKPNAIAEEIASPIAEDFPLPLLAVMLTVFLEFFSLIDSTIAITHLA